MAAYATTMSFRISKPSRVKLAPSGDEQVKMQCREGKERGGGQKTMQEK